MIHELALKAAEYLHRALDLDNSQGAVIAYGLEAIIGSVVKLVTFTTVTLIMGIFPQATAVMLASALFRLSTGGAHYTAYYRCLIVSMLVFCILGFLAKMAIVYDPPVSLVLYFALILAALATFFWVPADTPAKPVTHLGDKRKAKIWACATLAFYFLIYYRYAVSGDLLLAASLGLLSQVFKLTPVGFRITAMLDRFLLSVSGPLAGERG